MNIFALLFGGGGRAAARGIASFIKQEAKQYAIEEYVQEGIIEALAEMEAMCGNAGQFAIYEKYIIDAFPLAAEEKLILERANHLKPEHIEMPHKEAVELILEAGCEIVNEFYMMAQEEDVWLDFI